MGKIFRWAVVLVLLVILISGSVAFYTVFFGGKDLVIPPLREMSVLDAVDEAERLGLAVKIEQVDSSIPSGTVLAQWPEPGTKVRKDKSIILKVSKGGNRKMVPDLRGLEYSQAVDKVAELGFAPGDTLKINDDQRPAGTVIAQNPAGASMVPPDRKIELLVSLGPVPKDGKIPLPDLAQLQEAAARDLLAESGLRLGGVEYVSTRNTPEGMVMSTKPKAGTPVKKGTTVVLQVATNRRKEEPKAEKTPSETVDEPSGAVVVEQEPSTIRQVGPAGPVQTVLTPRQQEVAAATGLATPPAALPGQENQPAPPSRSRGPRLREVRKSAIRCRP
ncbi:PASTA domain-containing protein [Aminivibrio sp.]